MTDKYKDLKLNAEICEMILDALAKMRNHTDTQTEPVLIRRVERTMCTLYDFYLREQEKEAERIIQERKEKEFTAESGRLIGKFKNRVKKDG